MRNKKLVNQIVSVVIIGVVASCVLFGMYKLISNHNAKRLTSEISEDFRNTDRDQAVIELITLRGRVMEIQFLDASGSSDEDLLMEHLEIITQFESATRYDFTFQTEASEVGAICVELLTQIDEQIDIIQSDKKGD